MPPDEIGRMERAAKYWRGLYHLQSVTNVKIEFGKSGVGEKYADLEVERRGRPPANKMTTGRYKANTKHTPRTLIWLKSKQDKLGEMTKKILKPGFIYVVCIFHENPV